MLLCSIGNSSQAEPVVTPNPRQQRLLDQVRCHHNASVEALAKILDVTTQTVRRDVKLLVEANQLTRYHGGVTLPSSIENIAYVQRKGMNAEGKQRIAHQVVARIPEGSSLILNIGTTTEEVARAMLHRCGLRIVTNNLNVATILSDNAHSEVIVAGGIVRSRDRGIVGEATIDFIKQFKVDIGVIGISGIDKDGSLQDFDYREVRVAQTIIEQSRQVWLVADHSKFSREAMVRLAHLSQVDVLFTDHPVPPPFAAILREAKVELVVAK
jgi:DeoR family transcriptional regulator, glycerol-3-phosphate regulon repressor